MTGQTQLLSSLGVKTNTKREMPLHEKWLCYILNHDSPIKDAPIIMIERGPKNIEEIKKTVKNLTTCIVIFAHHNTLYLKAPNESNTTVMESDAEYERISNILKSCDIAQASSDIEMQIGITKAIDAIPVATGYFDNRGVFSTHYLRSRIFDDIRRNIDSEVDEIKSVLDKTSDEILETLGWNKFNSDDNMVSIIITNQDDFSIRNNDGDVAPSYTAISRLRKNKYVILTNGKKWRLYTNRISAASTNYFEITLGSHDSIMRYLVAIFGAASYVKKHNMTDIDLFFDEGRNYATRLEEDLSSKIMRPDGLFLDIVKGVLEHDMKKIFTTKDLDEAKQVSLEIMYRVWFIAYAESRNLLPIKDKKYRPISLQSIRNRLDSYGADLDNNTCWSDLLKLFKGIRNGSVPHNLPQYSGVLFSKKPQIDNISIQNRFIVPTLTGLLKKDGEPMDYASLGVRHLGNIFESLMEFVVRQAEKNIMLLEDKNGVREVKTQQESTYSYKKHDLYLASKGGIALRKMTASFYTPNEIVKFLVWQGLEPIFTEREKLIKEDLKRYRKSKADKNLQICMNRLLDIQVLDPAMGSGHFLVEALNRITSWVTSILDKYPDHPLLNEIETERNIVLSEQKKKGIIIDESLLTHDILLKRKVMKRCIFGVDLNPMAVELAKLSLWLDSFAIGVPLTFMDHHIKLGDSTIGMFLDDLKNKEMHTLDSWSPEAESNKMICDVICNSDITVAQVNESEDKYLEHKKTLDPTRRVLDALTASKINHKIIPKKLQKKGKEEYIHKFGRFTKNESNDFIQARNTVNQLAERHRFFHWELEMMDAFTDSRKGFDCIIGNPPWEVVETSDDEFFTQYEINFRSLKPKTKKNDKIKEIFKDLSIKKLYDEKKELSKGNGAFYTTYEMQGKEDKDMSLLILERVYNLVAKHGSISMVIPSQILTNSGAINMRKKLFEKNILSLYVFENRKKIFPIDSRYRFILLSIRNEIGPDEFPVGFYLHYLDSLYNDDKEKNKFGTLSKLRIQNLFPDECIIPEIIGERLDVFEKILQNNNLGSQLADGWNVEFIRGFNQSYDAHLLLKNGKGWPVLKGKNIHQYIYNYAVSEFTANSKDGLSHESKKKIFANQHTAIYNSYRLAFRSISSPTNMRTIITTIIPPHTFHTEALRAIILTQNGKITMDIEHNKKISYLCGILNSLAFDYATRAILQVNVPPIIKSLPIPKPIHEKKIAELTAKLVVGIPEFESFAESFRIPNIKLLPSQRIETVAELDALVAHSYDLTIEEYRTVIDSFKLFQRNPGLYNLEEIIWNNNNLKEFYGEMSDLALQYFEAVTEN